MHLQKLTDTLRRKGLKESANDIPQFQSNLQNIA